MRKAYQTPMAEKLSFDYSENVFASAANKCGGIYREFTDNYYGCHKTPTDNWVHPFTSEG